MTYWKYSTVYSPRTKRSWVTAGSLQQRHIHRSSRPDQSHDAHENPFNRLMQSNPVATMLLRWDDLTIIDVNPALVALVGFPAEALLGRELGELGFLVDRQEDVSLLRIFCKEGLSVIE